MPQGPGTYGKQRGRPKKKKAKKRKQIMAKWIQKAFKKIKAKGTEGVCTGAKFGGSTCRPGTKRYNMAKTLRKMAKKK